jgi:hypothetical protein
MRAGRAFRVTGLAAFGAVLALVAGCTSPDAGGASGKDSGGAGTPGGGTHKSAPRVSYLTGEPGAAGRVLAVKIDNVAQARPATALDDAAIVYAIEVEGGLSRLMAVYDAAGGLPRTIGPVRSARETDLQLLAEYGRPALAFSGAQSRLLPALRGSDTLTAVTGTRDFFRDPGRSAPHNEYLHPAAAAAKGGRAKDIGLRFSADVPAGGRAAAKASAAMPAARFSFTYRGGRYHVAMDGAASPWTADNVIIQHVTVKESRYRSRTGFVPFTQTVGHGTARVLRDGRAYDAVWDRPAASDGTVYTVHGRRLPLRPGRTWIVLEP